VRWVLPQAHQYLTYWPRLVSGFAGRAFENGTAHHAEPFCGIALWLPPGVGPDEEAMGAVLEESIPDSRQGEIFALLEKMGHSIPPSRTGIYRSSASTPRSTGRAIDRPSCSTR
jgi:hypothetical protein